MTLRLLRYTVLTLVVVLALGSCQIPLGNSTSTGDPPVESATLKITIPTIGSGLRSLADAPDETTPSCTLDTFLQPRAMLLATGAEVRLYNDYDLSLIHI